MEAMDFFIFLLGTITVMLGYYLTQLSEDLKELEKGTAGAYVPMLYDPWVLASGWFIS